MNFQHLDIPRTEGLHGSMIFDQGTVVSIHQTAKGVDIWRTHRNGGFKHVPVDLLVACRGGKWALVVEDGVSAVGQEWHHVNGLLNLHPIRVHILDACNPLQDGRLQFLQNKITFKSNFSTVIIKCKTCQGRVRVRSFDSVEENSNHGERVRIARLYRFGCTPILFVVVHEMHLLFFIQICAQVFM